jgi:hypothetical protein
MERHRMRTHLVTLALALLALPAAASADSIFVFVPGTSDPWLAGVPVGTKASGYPSGVPDIDSAPANSPAQVPGLPVTGGFKMTFNATGTAAYGPPPVIGPDTKMSGPDGMLYYGRFIHHLKGAQNGISDAWTPINGLLGVFLDGSSPLGKTAPGTLDFRTGAGTGYASIAPALRQVFFIGDGLDAGAAQQQVTAPTGATRLFLGISDGWNWTDNGGPNRKGYAVRVTYENVAVRPAAVDTPEPGSLALLAVGAACLGWRIRRRKASGAA